MPRRRVGIDPEVSVETREKVFAGVAAVGLVIALAALAVAVAAKNDEQSNAELTEQGRQQLEAKADQLQKELAKDEEATGAAGTQAKKANRRARAARREAESVKAELDELKSKVDEIEREERRLADQQQSQFRDLKNDFKTLRKTKANR